ERRNWLNAHPYAQSYLALHAAEAGLLDQLVVDPLFLVAAEPGSLRVVLSRSHTREARRFAAVYSVAAHELDISPAERASYLELAARKLRFAVPGDAFAALDLPRSWSARGAVWEATTPHWMLVGHREKVDAVAIAEWKGRLVIVSGGPHELRLWDFETLEPIGIPLRDAWVSALAVVVRQG